MKKYQRMASLVALPIVCLASTGLSSCNSNPVKRTQASMPSSPAAQNFSKPLIPPANRLLPPVPIQGMIQSTDGKARLPQVVVSGKRDPFAAILPTQLRVSLKPSTKLDAAPKKSQNTVPISSQAPLPPTPIQAPTLPAPAPITVLPPIPTSSAPISVNSTSIPMPSALSPTSLADAIEITGVVQIAGKFSAIVQEPNAAARYVQPGDSLAGGQVLLKRITMSSSGNPTIVLQQNGIEIMKMIGSKG